MITDVRPYTPYIILTIVAVVVMLLDTLPRRRGTPILGWITTLGAVAALVADWTTPGAPVAGFLRFDAFSRSFDTIILSILALVALGSTATEERMKFAGEYYSLLTISAMGLMLVACSGGLMPMYIGIELSTMCLYTLVGIAKRDRRSAEAAMKLFVLGAVASAVLLYGISIVYGVAGGTQFSTIAAACSNLSGGTSAIALCLGVAFIVGGIAFKMSAAPFHLWSPDVYEGAPSTVAAFLSTASKTAAFAAIIRFLVTSLAANAQRWLPMIVAVAILSMVVGNVVAVVQTNLKRLLAYSGIAQAGYILVAVAAAHRPDTHGLSAVWTYLFLYGFTNVAGFLIVEAVYHATGSDRIDALRGLHKRSPLLAFAALIVLFSLGGIPPLAGFVGKLYLFAAGWQGDQYALVVVGASTSVIALYYYLMVALQVYIRDPEDDRKLPVPRTLGWAIGICIAAVIAIGIFPRPWIHLGDEAEQAATESSTRSIGLVRAP